MLIDASRLEDDDATFFSVFAFFVADWVANQGRRGGERPLSIASSFSISESELGNIPLLATLELLEAMHKW
jgi:hypothetical protein